MKPIQMFDKCMTSDLGLVPQALMRTKMEKKVSIREFLRNYKKYAKKKSATIICNRGEPETVCIPYDLWEGSNTNEQEITLESLKPFQIKTKEKNISKNVDKILTEDVFKDLYN